MARTAIDAFVLAQLEHKGWTMQPEADRRTLIRRATFDLWGLPPTPAEVQAFVDDPAPNAWEKVVDRLLASRHYGEQWGRHWLDVAGYSDSRGDAGDSDREVSWKYRDYVINAFNKNKPIDRFIVEQMAGDQLVNYKHLSIPTPEQIEPLTATGFLRTTADITDNQTIYEVDKYFDAQQKAMETSLTSLLGVTIQCARCHDHKFDPFSQRDYYKLMAVYQPVWDPENWLPANLKYGPWPSRVVLDMDPVSRDAWIKDVTSNDAKAIRRLDDLLEATYQRYRAELRAGRDISDEPKRLQMRKDMENDPDLDVDRNAPKDGMTDQEMDKRFPELAKWKDEIQAKRYAREGRHHGPAELYRGGLGSVEDSVAHLRPGSRQLSRAGRGDAAWTADGPGQSEASARVPRPGEASGVERHQPPPGSREMDGLAGESAGSARVRQSRLGMAFRRRAGPLDGRFRDAGRKADASGAARLPDGQLRGAQLGPEVADEGNPDVAGLSPAIDGDAGAHGGRSGEQVPVAEGAAPPRSGDHPRFDAQGQRPPERADVRQAGADQARPRRAMDRGWEPGPRHEPAQPVSGPDPHPDQ